MKDLRKRYCIGCHVEIRPPWIACRICWYELPVEIRKRVAASDLKTSIPGVVEAVVWFREQGEAK